MTVFEDLVVKNAVDFELARCGKLKDSEVRQATVRFKVDTGAHKNLINRDVFEALGLRKVGVQEITTAGGAKFIFDKTSGMELHWRDRDTIMPAFISPKPANNLLSVTALEEMGLKVDPVNVRLEYAFPDGISCEIEEL